MSSSRRTPHDGPSYLVEPLDLHAHLLRVTLTLPDPAPRQRLSLPVWIPGSYLVREFARHVEHVEARQGGRSCSLQKVDKTSWVAQCQPGQGPLQVQARVYAFDPSVRAACLDDRRGFFNGTSLLLRAEGREQHKHRLEIAGLPPGWRVATAMPPVRVRAEGQGVYEAADYDELVDHPFELGPFWEGRFEACGVPHRFVVAGAPANFNGDRLIEDARRICEAQIRFWHGRGRPPFERYVFMLHAVEEGYGGLEHRASTALICRRQDLPVRPAPAATGDVPTRSEGYVTLLGLISHEYFHTWNVKRLRPVELAPVDYTRENHTSLLWFFEGFTSYYDDLFLRRAGLIDVPRYLQLLARTVHAVEQTPGRHVQSVAEASFDAWTKYYRADENTPNLTVSYYTRGALVALALDLSLRVAGRSLDEVMRLLWKRSGGGAVALTDIMAAVREVGGVALARKLGAWVHRPGDLPLAPLWRRVGIEVLREPPTVAQRLGLRAQERDGRVHVKAVLREGAAHRAGMSAGDEWIGVNGWRIAQLADVEAHAGTGAAEWLVARGQRLLTLTLPADAPQGAGAVKLRVSSRPAQAAEAIRRAWLR